MESVLEDFDIAELRDAWHQPGSQGGSRIALIYLNGLGELRGSSFDFSNQRIARRWFQEIFPGIELHRK